MKKGLILVVLGVAGIAQYAYFQLFTKLAFSYEYKLAPEYIDGKQFDMVNTTVTRDWTLGILVAIIGIVLLIFGIASIRRHNSQKQESSNEQ